MDITLELPAKLSDWETVATLLIAQTMEFGVDCASSEQLSLAALTTLDTRMDSIYRVSPAYETAYRVIDSDQGKDYFRVLAESSYLAESNALAESGNLLSRLVHKEITPLVFPDFQAQQDGGIIVCPFAPKPELQLPERAWMAAIRMLRSYGHPVCLMGEPGQRMDNAMFTENLIVSDVPVHQKIAMLSDARLIVGVPNAWTWLATSWEKPVVYFYPEGVGPRKWFPFSGESYGRCLFEPHRLFVPAVLAGLRLLIAQLGKPI